uniref:C-type lectin domain-containing protein n=1 Tax=Mola mola TaxID=94237 RepID=A0A3Q4ABC9_MOLML
NNTFLFLTKVFDFFTATLCWKCEEGWEKFKEQCYYFTNNSSPWEKAREMCQNRGGDLVRIKSKNDADTCMFSVKTFLGQKLREKMSVNQDKFWIGLTDSQTEGKWLWVDGSPLDESPKEPDDWKSENTDGEDCARMGEKGQTKSLNDWFDKSCLKSHRSICEKPGEHGHLLCA